MVIANNLAWGRNGKRVSGQDGSTGMILWMRNLLFGDDALRHKDGIFDVDPLMISPALGISPDNFKLKSESPAVGKGIAAIAPVDDLDGNLRNPKLKIDLGAYQLK
jgi:hypothetical protein